MNPVDAAVLALIGLGAAFGARRGLVAQIARLLALAGGLVIARIASPEAAAAVRALAPSIGPPLDRTVAFLAVFAGAAGAVTAGGTWAGRRVRNSRLATIDRAGGAVFGSLKGLLLCYVGLFVVLCSPGRPLEKELRASRAAPILLEAIGAAAPLFPPEFEARGRETARDIAVARAGGPSGGVAEPAPAPEPCALEEGGKASSAAEEPAKRGAGKKGPAIPGEPAGDEGRDEGPPLPPDSGRVPAAR